ncbi:hypothetical protein [Alkalibacillus almallahensis]|uniref:hypothetical protein n=1 Tax=Alkalibacillus almallahensis TaxID=1379154 RepID=UPI001422A6BF|nr:hypothetical protein [Alkalibacillus almallahensis]NIK11737.1 ribosomal protein L7/L12 [Alkalibacillus almallahensis]
MEVNFLETLILFIGVYLLFAVNKLDGRVKNMNYNLEQISKKVDVPEKPINNELRELLDEGNDVEAVKKVRETMGLSLVEAKQYVDALKLESK